MHLKRKPKNKISHCVVLSYHCHCLVSPQLLSQFPPPLLLDPHPDLSPRYLVKVCSLSPQYVHLQPSDTLFDISLVHFVPLLCPFSSCLVLFCSQSWQWSISDCFLFLICTCFSLFTDHSLSVLFCLSYSSLVPVFLGFCSHSVWAHWSGHWSENGWKGWMTGANMTWHDTADELVW